MLIQDFDIDYSTSSDPATDVVNLNALEKLQLTTQIRLLHDICPQKKLLVLDLDYTLFDCKSQVSHISELARPGLHDFLSIIGKYYEFCIWSQTSWRVFTINSSG